MCEVCDPDKGRDWHNGKRKTEKEKVPITPSTNKQGDKQTERQK